MIGRRALGRRGIATLVGLALPLAFGGAQALAADGEAPHLVKVTGSEAMIEQLGAQYDVGYVSDRTEAAVYVTHDEEAQLRALGYKVGEVLEDQSTWLARKAEIAATTEAETLASRFAKQWISKAGVVHKGKRIVPPPG